MAVYTTPEQNAANPPSSWTVHKARKGLWHVRDRAGTTIESATTRREAERLRLDGPTARHWDKERRWYAGEPMPGWRPYREVVADRAAAEKARNRRAEMFAAKWLADTESAEPPERWPTTDANLAQVFAGCARPPSRLLYPAIRAKLADRSWLVT